MAKNDYKYIITLLYVTHIHFLNQGRILKCDIDSKDYNVDYLLECHSFFSFETVNQNVDYLLKCHSFFLFETVNQILAYL